MRDLASRPLASPAGGGGSGLVEHLEPDRLDAHLRIETVEPFGGELAFDADPDTGSEPCAEVGRQQVAGDENGHGKILGVEAKETEPEEIEAVESGPEPVSVEFGIQGSLEDGEVLGGVERAVHRCLLETGQTLLTTRRGAGRFGSARWFTGSSRRGFPRRVRPRRRGSRRA